VQLVKYWMLGAACVVWGIVVAVLRKVDPGAARIALFASYLVPTFACAATATTYGARDRLRWAWIVFAAGYGVAFVSKTVIGDLSDVADAAAGRQLIWSLFIVMFNAGTVGGLVLFASVWSGTGMAPPWRRWATLGFFALAMVVAIPQFHRTAGLIATSKLIAIGGTASVVGDIFSITLIGPIFATMIALRGGVLARPWIFIFASVLCWLINNVPPLLPGEIANYYDGVVRPAAITFAGAAGIAQIWVQREVRASLPD
jgi:hypothetical protein